jgi:hypothetical protein
MIGSVQQADNQESKQVDEVDMPVVRDWNARREVTEVTCEETGWWDEVATPFQLTLASRTRLADDGVAEPNGENELDPR